MAVFAYDVKFENRSGESIYFEMDMGNYLMYVLPFVFTS